MAEATKTIHLPEGQSKAWRNHGGVLLVDVVEPQPEQNDRKVFWLPDPGVKESCFHCKRGHYEFLIAYYPPYGPPGSRVSVFYKEWTPEDGVCEACCRGVVQSVECERLIDRVPIRDPLMHHLYSQWAFDNEELARQWHEDKSFCIFSLLAAEGIE